MRNGGLSVSNPPICSVTNTSACSLVVGGSAELYLPTRELWTGPHTSISQRDVCAHVHVVMVSRVQINLHEGVLRLCYAPVCRWDGDFISVAGRRNGIQIGDRVTVVF